MGEIWKDSCVGHNKSQKQIRGDRWSKDVGRESSLCLTDGHLSFEECRIGGVAPEIQRSSCSPRRYCERWFWILYSIHWTRFISIGSSSIANDGSKSNGYHIKTTRMRRTRSRCSISLYPGQNGRCSKIVQNSKIGMSRQKDSSTTTQLAKIMVQYGRPSRSSWTKSVMVILWQDCYGKGNLRKSSWSTVGRKFPMRNACDSYQCMWMTSNCLERNNFQFDVESTKQRSWFGRTNILP